MQNWKTEHPKANVPKDVISRLEELSFDDSSWSADVCPSWSIKLGDLSLVMFLEVWIDYPDKNDRMIDGSLRYRVCVYNGLRDTRFVVLQTEKKECLLSWLSNEPIVNLVDDREVPFVSLKTLMSIPPPLLAALVSISRDDCRAIVWWLHGGSSATSRMIDVLQAIAS